MGSKVCWPREIIRGAHIRTSHMDLFPILKHMIILIVIFVSFSAGIFVAPFLDIVSARLCGKQRPFLKLNIGWQATHLLALKSRHRCSILVALAEIFEGSVSVRSTRDQPSRQQKRTL